MTTANCATCGESVPVEPANTPRVPCPVCGSIARQFGVKLESSLKVSGSFKGVVTRDDKPVGYVETGTEKIKRHTTYTADGKIVLNLHGLAPRNEEDVPDVCEILVSGMNRDGIEAFLIGPPIEKRPTDQDYKIEVEGSELGVQVVRAITTQEFWEELHTHHAVAELVLTVSDCTNSLLKAIKHKQGKYPLAQRSSLILVLDAFRVPALAVGNVTDQFKKEHAASIRALGFHSVYVVGPEPLFVSKLDEDF